MISNTGLNATGRLREEDSGGRLEEGEDQEEGATRAMRRERLRRP
jgi:hypothetical protein